MVRFFECYRCVTAARRRRLQVVTVNSVITVENGRLGNLKKTQGNNFVFLKKVYFWRRDRVTRPETHTLVCIDQSGPSSLGLLAGKQTRPSCDVNIKQHVWVTNHICVKGR